jgi:membrane protein
MATSDASLRELLRIFSSRFTEDRCVQTASSLTFTTLIALVPMITVALSVASAFPGFESLLWTLRDFVVTNMLPESVSAISAYARQFSENAAHLTIVGVTVLGVTALLLTLTIDHAFNSIWRVSRPRPLLRRVLLYLTVLTVGPLLIGASLSLTSYLLTLSLDVLGELPAMKHAVLRFVPLVLTTLAFALLYLTVPNCPVLKRDALAGGIAAGAAFEVMKHAFGFYITHFPAYKLVYGAFAAVPIFLLWVYLSWLIVISGAVLVAVLPEWRGLAPPALRVPGSDFVDGLRVLKTLWLARASGEAVPHSKLDRDVKCRGARLDGILDTLVAAAWVARSKSGGWVLNRDAAAIKVEDVYRQFVFRAPAAGPGYGSDAQLASLVAGISTRISTEMQMSLADVFADPGEYAHAVEHVPEARRA